MEFTETLTLKMPRIESQLNEFSEAAFSANHGLVIELAAIHEGTTANFNHYSAEALTESLLSWTTPYPKPIIMHHDPYTEPLGRVIGARMDKEADGTPYVRLQVAVTDPAAIEKIKDQRYLTGSVGGKAGEATCSICGANWAEASMFNLPCKHRRGSTYKGKVATIEMKNITFKEYSFVNMPADQRSSIRSISTGVSESEVADADMSAARFFSLDMAKEAIVEFCESETRDVLAGLKKKEAAPLYLGLKGSFLSALAVEAEENHQTDEESDMADAENRDVEEDVLAVAEGLSADLSKTEESEEEQETEAEDVVPEETDEAEAEADAEEEEVEETEESEETAEETEASDEAPAEEATERPQGQEKGHTSDVDPETSKGADKTRESEDEAPVEEDVAEETVDSTDLEEAIKALESRVAELETQEAALLEENAKLKAALKKGLAERVVDTKIALGIVERSNREVELEEHVKRSAASLADSMRDLATMTVKSRNDYSEMPTVEPESTAVEDGDSVILAELRESESPKAPDAEELFFDVLMGRRSL